MAQASLKSESTLTTLNKGLHILEILATEDAGQGLTLTELSHVLRMHRTTLFRFLATLLARGYVERDPATDRYRLGIRVLFLASTLLNDLDIRQVARPALEALGDRTQELVHLTVLDHGEVITVDRIEGKHSLSLQTRVGERRPAYCTASGKALLAFLPAGDVDKILAAGMPAVTKQTITSPDAMHQHLAEVRRRGFAWDDEERVEGVRCVAAPVFSYEGRVAGAISIAMPTLRTSLERLWQLGIEVRTAAEEISQLLGHLGTTANADMQSARHLHSS